MNGDSGSLWDFRFRCNRNTAVGARKKRLWYFGGRGASICRWVTPSVDTALVPCLERVDYEKALGHSLLTSQS